MKKNKERLKEIKEIYLKDEEYEIPEEVLDKTEELIDKISFEENQPFIIPTTKGMLCEWSGYYKDGLQEDEKVIKEKLKTVLSDGKIIRDTVLKEYDRNIIGLEIYKNNSILTVIGTKAENVKKYDNVKDMYEIFCVEFEEIDEQVISFLEELVMKSKECLGDVSNIKEFCIERLGKERIRDEI